MRVRLQNIELANRSMSRREVYKFDADGFTTVGYYEDVKMLIEQNGCKLIDLVEGDGEMEVNKTFVLDMEHLVRNGNNDEIVKQINYVIREHFSAFIANNGKVLLVK